MFCGTILFPPLQIDKTSKQPLEILCVTVYEDGRPTRASGFYPGQKSIILPLLTRRAIQQVLKEYSLMC